MASGTPSLLDSCHSMYYVILIMLIIIQMYLYIMSRHFIKCQLILGKVLKNEFYHKFLRQFIDYYGNFGYMLK